MVSSVLRPEKIVGRQNKNKVAAQNFISGGSILGSSVVNSAANKIVGFQRAGIRPSTSAIESIVSTISTNINNNITTVINKTLQGFSADYQKRLQQVDDAKPTGILGKFLNVYNSALGFIQFFGNRKNIDKVRDNLDALKKSFTESFEVAKLIRQVIVKIVKQLSSLPVASPSGGGGLNLDIDLPGGLLKRNAPRGLGRMMGGGKMLALGAGALGLGALGAGAVNALQDDQQVQAAQTTPNIPGDDDDRFASIVDRFANAISELFKIGKDKGKKGSAASSPASSPSGPGPGGPSPGGPFTPNATQLNSGQYKDLINQASQISGVPSSQIAAMAKIESSFDPNNISKSGALGLMQLMPGTYENLYRKYGKQYNLTDNITDPKTNLFLGSLYFRDILSGPAQGNLETAVKMYNAGPNGILDSTQPVEHWRKFQRALPEFQNLERGLETNITPLTQIPTASPPAPILPSPQLGQGGPDLPSWLMPSPIPNIQRIATTAGIAQPPPSQQMQQPVVLPIDLTGGTQQQTGGGGVTPAVSSPKNGPAVPFLPSANTDNFLVLYSKMVYNIVDG